MQSNILLFILFSLIAITILHILPKKYTKYCLFAFNIIFYLLCDAKFAVILLFGICWSYIIGYHLLQDRNLKLLFVGLVPIIGILCFFKYYNFFIPQHSISLKLTIPLGISYYSFKIISYMIDCYNQKNAHSVKWIDYTNYVAFFPQIICGPISRFQNLEKQINNIRKPSSFMIAKGCLNILSGMFKKLVIADRLAPYVNTIFENHINYPSLALWMGAFFFTIQIYCDFAGYSEIVIGICNLLGIEIEPNFKNPYFSYNIKEFWNRWHISLSSWLKDYIYIPLGGNRKGTIRRILNLMTTFFISGIWHGNTLSFIFWGLYHGVFNLITCNTKKSHNKFKYVIQTVITFIIVMFGWIFFKVETITKAFSYITCMFQAFSLNMNSIITSIMPFTGDYSCLAYLLTICLFIVILFIIEYREFNNLDCKNEMNLKVMIYLITIIFFGVFGQNSFLYANF